MSASNNLLPLLEGEEARQIDLHVTEQLGRVRVLEGVATRVADTLLYHLNLSAETKFLFVAGKGNNGANAIAAARMLHMRGRNTEVVTLVDPFTAPDKNNNEKPLRPNVREQIELYQQFAGNGSLFPLDLERIRQFNKGGGGGVIVDGILGTGITDPPRGVSKDAIDAINTASASPSSTKVLSIDIPSGLNHITGEAPGSCVQATWTLNLHMIKKGQVQSVAQPYVGELYSAESGLGFSTFPGLEKTFVEFYKDGPIRKV